MKSKRLSMKRERNNGRPTKKSGKNLMNKERKNTSRGQRIESLSSNKEK